MNYRFGHTTINHKTEIKQSRKSIRLVLAVILRVSQSLNRHFSKEDVQVAKNT